MKTKNRKCMIQPMLVVLMLLSVFWSKQTIAQEGVYWGGLSLSNPAAISTPSDWIYGSYHFASPGNYLNGFAITADFNLGPKRGTIGANVFRENYDQIKEKITMAEICYAYTFPLSEKGQLGLGASLGFRNQKMDLSYYYSDSYDPYYIPSDDKEASDLKISGGLYYYTDKLELGVGYAAYSEQKNNYGGEYYSVDVVSNKFTLTAAYRFPVCKDFTLEPNLMYYSENDAFYTVPGVFGTFRNKVWAGYSNFDFNEVHNLMFGFDIKKIRLGYNYTFADLFSDSGSIHEFLIGIKLN